MCFRALHGQGGPAARPGPARTGRAGLYARPARSGRAGLYNFEKPSGRAGPRNYWAGPSRAGQHTARKIAIMTSLISVSINRAV